MTGSMAHAHRGSRRLSGVFDPAGSLPDPRERQTATVLPDGRVLVVGGEAGASPSTPAVVLRSAEVFGVH